MVSPTLGAHATWTWPCRHWHAPLNYAMCLMLRAQCRESFSKVSHGFTEQTEATQACERGKRGSPGAGWKRCSQGSSRCSRWQLEGVSGTVGVMDRARRANLIIDRITDATVIINEAFGYHTTLWLHRQRMDDGSGQWSHIFAGAWRPLREVNRVEKGHHSQKFGENEMRKRF